MLLLLKLLFYCKFGRRVCRERLSELTDSNCILLRIMSNFISSIALSWYACWSYSYWAPKLLCYCFWQPPPFFSKSVTFRCHVACLISFDPWCLFAWLFFHAFLVMSSLIPYHLWACLHWLSCLRITLKCASWCWQIVPVTCFACIFLTVTPFGVLFICNLISFSCTLCLCYCLLLLTNLKYGLGQNSTKSFNCCAALSVCHV